MLWRNIYSSSNPSFNNHLHSNHEWIIKYDNSFRFKMKYTSQCAIMKFSHKLMIQDHKYYIFCFVCYSNWNTSVWQNKFQVSYTNMKLTLSTQSNCNGLFHLWLRIVPKLSVGMKGLITNYYEPPANLPKSAARALSLSPLAFFNSSTTWWRGKPLFINCVMSASGNNGWTLEDEVADEPPVSNKLNVLL